MACWLAVRKTGYTRLRWLRELRPECGRCELAPERACQLGEGCQCFATVSPDSRSNSSTHEGHPGSQSLSHKHPKEPFQPTLIFGELPERLTWVVGIVLFHVKIGRRGEDKIEGLIPKRQHGLLAVQGLSGGALESERSSGLH